MFICDSFWRANCEALSGFGLAIIVVFVSAANPSRQAKNPAKVFKPAVDQVPWSP